MDRYRCIEVPQTIDAVKGPAIEYTINEHISRLESATGDHWQLHSIVFLPPMSLLLTFRNLDRA